MTKPILCVHRRNRIDQLDVLPKGCWIEIDLDVHEGVVYLHHDPLPTHPEKMSPVPDRFDAFLKKALEVGVAGFVVDCKRENVEKYVQELLDKNNVTNYCYLNEMEIQADIFLEKVPTHRNCIRIWKYRGAEDVIRYATDMKAQGFNQPTWSWIDCWQHGLLQDTKNAHLPINGDEAKRLQAAGVKLCICSPELYVHVYGRDYSADELAALKEGVDIFRKKMEAEGIVADAVCTKFAAWWGL